MSLRRCAEFLTLPVSCSFLFGLNLVLRRFVSAVRHLYSVVRACAVVFAEKLGYNTSSSTSVMSVGAIFK
jgi:hypothetical protein